MTLCLPCVALGIRGLPGHKKLQRSEAQGSKKVKKHPVLDAKSDGSCVVQHLEFQGRYNFLHCRKSVLALFFGLGSRTNEVHTDASEQHQGANASVQKSDLHFLGVLITFQC